MSVLHARYLSMALFFIFIFSSGFWLMISGKPFNGIVFTVHKLVSIATLVFLGVMVSQVNQHNQLTAIQIAVIVSTGLFFLITIVSGGLLSIDKSMPTIILIIHRIMPVLSLLSTALMLYLIFIKKS